jgi:hypothetical protein
MGYISIASSTDGKNFINPQHVLQNMTTSSAALAVLPKYLNNNPQTALHDELQLAFTMADTSICTLSQGTDGAFGSQSICHEYSNNSPALASFNGRLYMAFTGTNKSIYVLSSANETILFDRKIKLDETSVHSPALTVFQNKLYLAFTGENQSLYILSSTDGNKFSSHTKLDNTSKAAPSLTVFQNSLYMAFIGSDNDGFLNLWSSTNGINFDQQIIFRDKKSAISPTITTFGDSLYMAFIGLDRGVTIASSTDAKNSWQYEALPMVSDTSTALIAFGNTLYFSFVEYIAPASCDNDALGKKYPNGWNKTIDNGTPCAEFKSSDSNYRTKQPSWTINPDGTGTAIMQMDHVRGSSLEADDHATLTASFLPTAELYSAAIEWSKGGKWAIELAEKIIVKLEDEIITAASEEAAADAVIIADLLSDGLLAPLDPVIEKVASDLTSKLITSLFSSLNTMLHKELDHDDGGRQTFFAVVNHNFNKLSNSIRAASPVTPLNFGIGIDIGAFPQKLLNALTTASMKGTNGSSIVPHSVSWKGDQTSTYLASGVDHNNYTTALTFSTWKPDCSAYPMQMGLYVSTKIDLKHGTLAKDGHYIIMIGFSSDGAVISAQASLEYPPDMNQISILSTLFTGNDAIEQLVKDLSTNSAALNFAAPNAVKVNMEAIAQSICVGMITLTSGQVLQINDRLVSSNGQYTLILQTDGNLVIYCLANGNPTWSSNTYGKGSKNFTLQPDGNLVIHGADGKVIWETNSKGGTLLIMEDNGVASLYNPDGTMAWNTSQRLV